MIWKKIPHKSCFLKVISLLINSFALSDCENQRNSQIDFI